MEHIFSNKKHGEIEDVKKFVQEELISNSVIHILKDAVTDNSYVSVENAIDAADMMVDENNPRFILIIDDTDDDTLVRNLKHFCGKWFNDERISKVFKLSDFSGDGDAEKVKLVSGVKFAADEGRCVFLSQTETINECFYDLFNQHYKLQQIKNKDGNMITRRYANIAIGSLSQPCAIDKNFNCILHLKSSDLESAPIPLLNRFEKYFITQKDMYNYVLETHSNIE